MIISEGQSCGSVGSTCHPLRVRWGDNRRKRERRDLWLAAEGRCSDVEGPAWVACLQVTLQILQGVGCYALRSTGLGWATWRPGTDTGRAVFSPEMIVKAMRMNRLQRGLWKYPYIRGREKWEDWWEHLNGFSQRRWGRTRKVGANEVEFGGNPGVVSCASPTQGLCENRWGEVWCHYRAVFGDLGHRWSISA